MTTIKEQWEIFQSQPVNEKLSTFDIKISRNAFYAGFLSMLTVASELGADEDMPDDEGMEMIDGLFQEVSEYFEELNVAQEN